MGADMPLISVVEDRLAVLKRMQTRLSQQVDVCGDERALCLLMTRLQDVMREISELDVAAQTCAADEIAQRRQERRAARRRKA